MWVKTQVLIVDEISMIDPGPSPPLQTFHFANAFLQFSSQSSTSSARSSAKILVPSVRPSLPVFPPR